MFANPLQVRFTPEAITSLLNGRSVSTSAGNGNESGPSGSSSRFLEFALDLFRVYLRHHPTAEQGVPAVHDPCAVGALLDELRRARDPRYCALFESRPLHVQVDLQYALLCSSLNSLFFQFSFASSDH